MAKKPKLTIIVRNERGNPEDLDVYGNTRSWETLGDDSDRKTIDGRRVVYDYFHDTNGKLPDSARAVLYRMNGSIEKIAYIDGAYSEDFDLQRKLNRMLDIRLKR